MNKELLESLKNKSREERLSYFNEHKSELLDEALQSVNGGADEFPEEYRNPDSDCPYKGNWISSEGFVCKGEVQC